MFCSEPSDLVARLALLHQSGYTVCGRLHLYASRVRKLTLLVLCSGGLFALRLPQLLQRVEG